MYQRRCLVHASNYFIWEMYGGSQEKYAIQYPYLASIYHLENHDGMTVPFFVIFAERRLRDSTGFQQKM